MERLNRICLFCRIDTFEAVCPKCRKRTWRPPDTSKLIKVDEEPVKKVVLANKNRKTKRVRGTVGIDNEKLSQRYKKLESMFL